MLPMFPDSVVPRAKIRVRFLQGRLRRSLRVAPRGAMLVQEVGRAVGGTPLKPLCGRLVWRAVVGMQVGLNNSPGESVCWCVSDLDAGRRW